MNPQTRSRLLFDLRCALQSSEPNWFTAQLFSVMLKADPYNLDRFRLGFPEAVQIIEEWRSSPDEEKFFNEGEIVCPE